MEGLTRDDGERYIKRKLSLLLFEILEFPPKKDILYLGVCYCQLTRRFGLSEIPLDELKKCLSRYLIDFDRYPWRDYLLELGLFYLRDGNDRPVRGRELISFDPGNDSTLCIDTKFRGFFRVDFCKKIFRYWYLTKKWDDFSPPRGGWDVIEKAVALFNEGLYSEVLFYLEDYLPLLRDSEGLLMYRVLRSLAVLGEQIEEGQFEGALNEASRLKLFLKEFGGELKGLPYDFKRLRKTLSSLSDELSRGEVILREPLRLERKGKNRLREWFEKILKWLPIFR